MPDLSIVIPSYDTAAMTLRCCRAVLASMPDSSEVIVADDGSTDGTAEVLAREAPEVRVVRLESNRGFAAAANRGVAAAAGRIVLLLNSDAVAEADALGAILAAFDDDPRLGVAGARLLNDDGTPQWSGGRTPTLPWMIGAVSGAGHLSRFFRRSSDGTRREVDWVSGAAMAFRREVWKDAGPLNERFLFYCQDIEFCLRAKTAGWRVRVIEEARVTHGLGRTILATGRRAHPDAAPALSRREPGGLDPERLWPDLLTWGTAHHGRRWSMLARPSLVAAAAARIAWRKLRRPLRRDATTDALVRAMRRLAQRDPQSDS